MTKHGAKIKAEQQIEKRERLTRKKRWERQGEDEQYGVTQLDRDVVTLALNWAKIDFVRLCMKVDEAAVHGRHGPVKTE